MNEVTKDILKHYGTKRHSGRYPYGSGKEPYQHAGDFLTRVEKSRRDGMSETEIAKSLELSTKEYRLQVAIAGDERRQEDYAKIKALRDKGYSLNAIAKEMGYKNDSSVRSLLNEKAHDRMMAAKNTADFIKKQVDEQKMVDIGAGVEKEINVSRTMFDQAVYMLKQQGYEEYAGRIDQVTNPGKKTTVKVLAVPGTEHKEMFNTEDIGSLKEYITRDGGESFKPKFVYPASMDSKRLQIRYKEDGGEDRDGLIEIRRGVDDLSLDGSHYSQVRILVDGTHYIKGMAVYSDNMPPGVDVVFNTNKDKSKSKLECLKEIDKKDPNNPFGSYIKEEGGQHEYTGADGKKHLSLINKRADEGDWDSWKNKVPSQFLAKQNPDLIKKQLKLSLQDKYAEFDDIKSLNNPTIKRQLLESFANDCDSSAVHLKAASLPRQRYQVILPCATLSDKEIYAPNFKTGEKVALIRYPHAGTFEIPILTVNNKHKDSENMIGKNPKDAVVINKKVADRLSGADFDGDTVMVIPTGGKVKITSTKPLKDLEAFDPKMEYPKREGMKVMSKKYTQKEMGVISNLITDMTLKGATPDELARAVKHSMVVIDAAKHKLDYTRSYKENNIKELSSKYQGRIEDGKYREGASTLISRAKSEVRINKTIGTPKINPKTGELIYKEDPKTYISKKTGLPTHNKQKTTLMSVTKDARTLSSGHPKEEAYALYANKLKAMANDARKELLSTGKLKYDANANKVYEKEVKSLESKLRIAELNRPRERRAQMIANSKVKAIESMDNEMDKDELKKVRQRSLAEARVKVGAQRVPIEIDDREWEAIQAGAISDTKLKSILNHVDIDKLRERATPRTVNQLSQAKVDKIKMMQGMGYTNAEIAKSIGSSSSTVSKYLN